jgi:hypothetical protein
LFLSHSSTFISQHFSVKNASSPFVFYLVIYWRYLGLNSGPCVCLAGALPLEPFSLLCTQHFVMTYGKGPGAMPGTEHLPKK